MHVKHENNPEAFSRDMRHRVAVRASDRGALNYHTGGLNADVVLDQN